MSNRGQTQAGTFCSRDNYDDVISNEELFSFLARALEIAFYFSIVPDRLHPLFFFFSLFKGSQRKIQLMTVERGFFFRMEQDCFKLLKVRPFIYKKYNGDQMYKDNGCSRLYSTYLTSLNFFYSLAYYQCTLL